MLEIDCRDKSLRENSRPLSRITLRTQNTPNLREEQLHIEVWDSYMSLSLGLSILVTVKRQKVAVAKLVAE